MGYGMVSMYYVLYYVSFLILWGMVRLFYVLYYERYIFNLWVTISIYYELYYVSYINWNLNFKLVFGNILMEIRMTMLMSWLSII